MVVSNQASAKVTLDLSKEYLDELSSYKAGIGASLSRASTFVSTLKVQSENYLSAFSRISDVDVAEEAAALTKAQILQQSSAAVLSQANSQPERTLSLISSIA